MAAPVVLFVLPRIGHGGIERVTLQLMSGLDSAGFVCALALRSSDGDLIQLIDKSIKIFDLKSRNLVNFVPNLTKVINSLKPDVVITAFPDVALLTLLSAIFSRHSPVLIHGVHASHVDYSNSNLMVNFVRRMIFSLSAKIVYSQFDKIFSVSSGIKDEILENYKLDDSKVSVIHNPVLPRINFYGPIHSRQRIEGILNIVSIGRLSREKGFDLLLEAISMIPDYLPWNLHIYGDGKEKGALVNLANNLKINRKVFFHGFIKNPFDALENADVFVLPSRSEGFGNVLVEAMANEVPVIAFDCKHGPREILCGGVHGVLVPPENPILLAKAIEDFFNRKITIDVKESRRFAAKFNAEDSILSWKRMIDQSLKMR